MGKCLAEDHPLRSVNPSAKVVDDGEGPWKPYMAWFPRAAFTVKDGEKEYAFGCMKCGRIFRIRIREEPSHCPYCCGEVAWIFDDEREEDGRPG